RPGRLRLQPGVEQLIRVRERGALEEVQLHRALERPGRAHHPGARPHRRVPLPLLDDLGIGAAADPTEPGDQLPAPVAELGDPLIDQLGWGHAYLLALRRATMSVGLASNSAPRNGAVRCLDDS